MYNLLLFNFLDNNIMVFNSVISWIFLKYGDDDIFIV